METSEHPIIGSYRVLQPLGIDDTIKIYMVQRHNSPEPGFLTLSMLPPEVTRSQKHQTHFDETIERVATFSHPHILPIVDWGIDNGIPYVVRPFMSGGPLSQLIRTRGALQPTYTLERLAAIAGALDTLHEANIIHFGLKPDIILRDQYDVVYLSDFGVAKVHQEALGLPDAALPYTAPEVFLRAPSTPQVDIYSLAMIAFEMLTGHLPFRCVTRTQWMHAHLNRNIIPALENEKSLPPKVRDVLERALSKLSNSRYTSAGSFVNSLNQAFHGNRAKPLVPEKDFSSAGIFLQYQIPNFGRGSVSVRSEDSSSRLYVDALMAETTNTQEAVALYTRFIEARPQLAQGDAIERLFRLEQQLGQEQADRILAEARSAYENGDMEHAQLLADQVTIYLPSNNEAQALKELAAHDLTVSTHYRHALAAYESHHWNAVGMLLGELTDYEPNPPDPEGIFVIREDTASFLQEVRMTQGHESQVLCAAFAPDGLTIATGSTDRTFRIWDAASLDLIEVKEEHLGWVCQVEFNPDGDILFSASWDGEIKLWEIPGAYYSGIIAGLANQVRALAFAHHDPSMMATCASYFMTLWRIPYGKRAVMLREADRQPVISLAFSPTDPFLICGVNNGEVRIRDVEDENYRVIMSIEAHSGPVYAVDCSPDGMRIATAGRDGSARIFDLQTGAIVAEIAGHDDSIYDIRFSSDGSLVVTGGRNGLAKVWRARDGALIKILEGHEGVVRRALFAPDGRTLLTTGEDGTIRLWRIA